MLQPCGRNRGAVLLGEGGRLHEGEEVCHADGLAGFDAVVGGDAHGHGAHAVQVAGGPKDWAPN